MYLMNPNFAPAQVKRGAAIAMRELMWYDGNSN